MHGRPSKSIGTCPSSPPNPPWPRWSRPSRMMPPPTPVPSARTTRERVPLPAPNIHSPSARTFTSLSTTIGRPSQVAEVGEPDAFPLDQLARPRIGEPAQLDVALRAVAAVGEVLVVMAGMGHELAHATGQRGELFQHPRRGPVGLGAGLADEVVGGAGREPPSRPAPRA